MSNIIKTKPLKARDETHFFKLWLLLMKGLVHDLTETEMNFVAILLRKRLELSAKIKDEELLTEYLLNTKNKKEIIKELQWTNVFQLNNMIQKLKKKGILTESKGIISYMVPQIDNLSNVEIKFNITL